MSKEKFIEDFLKIKKEWDYEKEIAESKMRNFLISVAEDFGKCCIKNGLTLYKDDSYNYYFNPNTNLGIRIDIPKDIDLDSDYNTLILSVVYKVQSKILFTNKRVFFFYKNEPPEKTFSRFKKLNSKLELKRTKEFLKEYYPKLMLLDERKEKITNININN